MAQGCKSNKELREACCCCQEATVKHRQPEALVAAPSDLPGLPASSALTLSRVSHFFLDLGSCPLYCEMLSPQQETGEAEQWPAMWRGRARPGVLLKSMSCARLR